MTNPFLERKVFVNPKEFNRNIKRNRKGQMFVISGIFILVGFVLLFNIVDTHSITEEKQFQAIRILDKNIKNIANEYKITAGIASMQPGMAGQYFSQLSSYYRQQFDSNIFYVFVFVNGTDQKFFVLIGNYMDDDINVTVNSTGTNIAGNSSVLADGTYASTSFISVANGTKNITVTYNLGQSKTTEYFEINVSTRSRVFGFFDITLRSDDYMIRSKDVYERVW